MNWAGCRGRRTRAGGDGPRPARGARGARFHGWFSKQTSSQRRTRPRAAPGSAPASPSARARPAPRAGVARRSRRPGAGTRRTRRGRDGVDDGFEEGARDGRGRGARSSRPGELGRRVRAGTGRGDVGERRSETPPAPLGDHPDPRGWRRPPSPGGAAADSARRTRRADGDGSRPLENRAHDDVDAMEGGAFGTPPAPPPGTPRSVG